MGAAMGVAPKRSKIPFTGIKGQCRGNSNARRIRAVFMVQIIGNIRTIFAAANGNNAIKRTFIATMLVAEFYKLIFTLFRIKGFLGFHPPASVAATPFIESNSGARQYRNTVLKTTKIVRLISHELLLIEITTCSPQTDRHAGQHLAKAHA